MLMLNTGVTAFINAALNNIRWDALGWRSLSRFRSLRMNESNESSWREFYRAAVLELNSSLVQIRVNEALAAINARVSDGHWVPCDERIDMDEARSTLRELKSWQEVTRTRAWRVRTRDLRQISRS
jgi:hypothetical protein